MSPNKKIGYISPINENHNDQKRTIVRVTTLLVILHLSLALTAATLIPPSRSILNFIIVTIIILLCIFVIRLGYKRYQYIDIKQKRAAITKEMLDKQLNKDSI